VYYFPVVMKVIPTHLLILRSGTINVLSYRVAWHQSNQVLTTVVNWLKTRVMIIHHPDVILIDVVERCLHLLLMLFCC